MWTNRPGPRQLSICTEGQKPGCLGRKGATLLPPSLLRSPGRAGVWVPPGRRRGGLQTELYAPATCLGRGQPRRTPPRAQRGPDGWVPWNKINPRRCWTWRGAGEPSPGHWTLVNEGTRRRSTPGHWTWRGAGRTQPQDTGHWSLRGPGAPWPQSKVATL